MKELKSELKSNFNAFSKSLKKEISTSFNELNKYENDYLNSYCRISSFEAWKAYLIENLEQDESFNFFVEAQNDFIASHFLARIGSWRISLQSMRSSIENLLYFIFYKDHPVELKLWNIGKNKLPISDYISYYLNHPALIEIDTNIDVKSLLKNEYSTLSKAVHASTINFRMTKDDEFPAILIPKIEKLSQGMARERALLFLINIMLLSLYHKELDGAKLRSLRKAISFCIPNKYHDEIKLKFGVKLYK